MYIVIFDFSYILILSFIAISEIDFTKLKYGMKLYFTYDEEREFKGISDIVKSKENFPQTVIFGEPTNNEILSCSIYNTKWSI